MSVETFPTELPHFFGSDDSPGIVAVEQVGESTVRLYRRLGQNVMVEDVKTQPWLVVSSATARSIRGAVQQERLAGDGALDTRCEFAGWSQWQDAMTTLRQNSSPVITFRSLADQYLLSSGRGLFRGIEFGDLLRAQLDIETLTLDPFDPQASVVLASVALNGSEVVTFRADELGEAGLLEALTDWIQRVDPDVIEGHNIFNFDIPYLIQRASHHRVQLTWGRDRSSMRIVGERRFKAGARTIPYQSAWVRGRHVIDTYQQIQRYDATGQLHSYALKPVIAALGVTRGDRTFVAGADITASWNTDRERLIRYAQDDVLDVNTLSVLTLPTEFYQTRILPRGLQATATGGPGEKVNDLLVRFYIAARHSIPQPSAPHEYPGGYTEVRRVGHFSPVVKADVESLYPSIMLAEGIGPRTDTLGAFVPMLRTLTAQRLHAKREEQRSTGALQAQWHGIQLSYKVLINSFYGYLGYSRGWFSDFGAAERVTLKGREIIQHVVAELEGLGAKAIEIDTDGVYFQPPPGVVTFADESTIIDKLNERLPAGIRLAHDGRYQGMLSLKLKNYALLTYDGSVVLKGSSLRSRREELVLRAFITDAVAHLLAPDEYGAIRDFYLSVAERIVLGQLSVDELTRTETITDQTFRSDATRRLADIAQGMRVGERVRVYQSSDGRLRRAEEFAGDEDRDYLLRRLRDMAERFRPLYDEDAAFEYVFPLVTTRSNLEQLKSALPVTQLSMFD